MDARLDELSDGFVIVDCSGMVLRTNREQEPLVRGLPRVRSRRRAGVKVVHSGHGYEAAFYDARGRVWGAMSVVRDVTARNHARAQLAYLLPLVDHTEDVTVAADPGVWRVVAWNGGVPPLRWTAARLRVRG